MKSLSSPDVMKQIEKRHQFRHSKSLGQNFLKDPGIIAAIVEGSGIEPEDLVIEIGPGLGVLTAAAAEEAGRVIAIELDRDLIPILKETLFLYRNVEIVHADIMKTDLHALIRENQPAGKVRIIGNIPYYITTPIVMKLLEDRLPLDSITVMMQKEVADRILTGPGGKGCGALTAAVHYYCTVETVVQAPREVFHPRPKVDSTVIRLDLREEPAVSVQDEAMLFQVIRAGFGQRRKTLSNALTGVGGLTKEAVGQVLRDAAVDPGRRAETLSLQEFAAIADAVTETVSRGNPEESIPDGEPHRRH